MTNTAQMIFFICFQRQMFSLGIWTLRNEVKDRITNTHKYKHSQLQPDLQSMGEWCHEGGNSLKASMPLEQDWNNCCISTETKDNPVSWRTSFGTESLHDHNQSCHLLLCYNYCQSKQNTHARIQDNDINATTLVRVQEDIGFWCCIEQNSKAVGECPHWQYFSAYWKLLMICTNTLSMSSTQPKCLPLYSCRSKY